MQHKKVQCWIFAKTPEIPLKIPEEIQCLLFQTNEARGGFWQPVTGSVEVGEGFFEAACRELHEETGLIFESAPLDTGYEFEFNSKFGPAKERCFAAILSIPDTPKLDPKEHRDFRWLNPKEAMSLLKFESNIEGLKRAYRIAFGHDMI